MSPVARRTFKLCYVMCYGPASLCSVMCFTLQMVLRLEDRVEELEEEREHLQAKLGALQAQAGAGAGLNGVGPLGAKPSAA